MKKPLVSIIIAARNEEKHLEKCVESLMQQTFQDFEIIIVEGMSDDKTRKIAEKLVKKHKGKIRLLINPEKRAAEARNIGIKNAKGELIGYIDAHTTAKKDWLETLVKTIKKHKTWKGKKVGGVGSIHENPDKEEFTTAITEAFKHPLGGGGSSYKPGKKLRAVDTAYACLYKKEALEKIKQKNNEYYDTYFIKGQDAELNWRINKAGYALLLQPKAITYYYKRKDWESFKRQMINAGFWRAKITKKHPELVKPTLFAPLIMYLTIITLTIITIIKKTIITLTIAASIIIIYLLTIIITNIIIKVKNKKLVSKMIILMHWWYTTGLIKGFLLKKIKIKDRV